MAMVLTYVSLSSQMLLGKGIPTSLDFSIVFIMNEFDLC